VDQGPVHAWITEKFDANLRQPLNQSRIDWNEPRVRKYALSVTAGTATAARLEAERVAEPITRTIMDLVWRRLVFAWQQTNPLPEIPGVIEKRTVFNHSGDQLTICGCPK
jgi:hypothetical protein